MLYRNFATQAELDAEYNAQQSVPDFKAFAERYIQLSQQTRQELECKLGIKYGPGLAEYLDIFPAARPDAPVLLYFHGGYWRLFSSREFSFVAQGPVSAGVTTIVVNYALCPQVSLDEIVRQSRAAVAWVYENARSFGGDPARLFVCGHSAGGQLTAMLLSTDWGTTYDLPANTLAGGCAISGLFDLQPFPHTFLQPVLQLSPAEVERNSPLFHIPDQAAPLIVSYGSLETAEFQRQSRDFLVAWRAKGLEGRELPLTGKHHFNVIDGFERADSPLCQALLKLIG